MASMRVHELTKEFKLSSKDMLDRIHEMKIPAKSHASVLADAYVAKIRKKMGQVATTVVTENDEERTRIVTKDKVEELNRHAEEERVCCEAVEKERARRKEEDLSFFNSLRQSPCRMPLVTCLRLRNSFKNM